MPQAAAVLAAVAAVGLGMQTLAFPRLSRACMRPRNSRRAWQTCCAAVPEGGTVLLSQKVLGEEVWRAEAAAHRARLQGATRGAADPHHPVHNFLFKYYFW